MPSARISGAIPSGTCSRRQPTSLGHLTYWCSRISSSCPSKKLARSTGRGCAIWSSWWKYSAPRRLAPTASPSADCIRKCASPPTGSWTPTSDWWRSEEHTSELQSLAYLVCRLLLEKKKKSIVTDTAANDAITDLL